MSSEPEPSMVHDIFAAESLIAAWSAFLVGEESEKSMRARIARADQDTLGAVVLFATRAIQLLAEIGDEPVQNVRRRLRAEIAAGVAKSEVGEV